MKGKLWALLIFILVLNINVNLTDDDNQFCKVTDNPFAHHYSSEHDQSIEQRDILISEIFRNDMLNLHNNRRKLHCVPPLILDDKLNENAQTYAEHLARQDSRLIHSDRKGLLGENLYSTTASNPIQHPNADQVIRAWYNEIANYNYDIPSSIADTGHFTQIVWKDTKKLGIGIAFARNGRKMYVVAQYSPPGNYRHAFHSNVLPPKC